MRLTRLKESVAFGERFSVCLHFIVLLQQGDVSVGGLGGGQVPFAIINSCVSKEFNLCF